MKRMVGPLVVAALLLGAWPTAASAGPWTGLRRSAPRREAPGHPSGFPTFLQPTCDGLQLIVWNDAMTTRLSST
jgi:hypothetical protein